MHRWGHDAVEERKTMACKLTMLGALLGVWVLCGATAQGADRSTALALLDGADALMQQGKHAKALEVCDRAMQADPQCAEAQFKAAQCHEGMNKPAEAFKCYRKAGELAEGYNPRLVRDAQVAAEKISPGLVRLDNVDQDLVRKLLPVAKQALAAGHLETAMEAYAIVLNLQPGQKEAENGQAEAQAELRKRGDLIEAKLAEAMLAEVWYLIGSNKKADARKMAQELSGRHGQTLAGREAVQLLANDLRPPKKEDILALKKEVLAAEKRDKEVKAAVKAVAAKLETPPAPAPPSTGKRMEDVSVEKLVASAESEAKTLDKEQLIAKFKEAYDAGKAAYGKAAPGTPGNQENLAQALENFTRCEALFLKLEETKLANAELEALNQEASMLRYGCMKMTILTRY